MFYGRLNGLMSPVLNGNGASTKGAVDLQGHTNVHLVSTGFRVSQVHYVKQKEYKNFEKEKNNW